MAADPSIENVNEELIEDSQNMDGDGSQNTRQEDAVDHSMDDLAAALTSVPPRKQTASKADALDLDDEAIDEVTGESTEAPVDLLTNPPAPPPPPPPKPKPSAILPLSPPDPEAEPSAPPQSSTPQNFGDLAIAPNSSDSEKPTEAAEKSEASADIEDESEAEEDTAPKPVPWFEPPIERSPTLVLAPVGDRVRMTLPADPSAGNGGLTWTALWQKLMHQVHNEKHFWTPEMEVELVCYGRVLEERQLGAIAEVLEEVQLQPVKMFCDFAETAQVAIAAGYTLSYTPSDEEPSEEREEGEIGAIDGLYLDKSVRSGVEINYPGSVMVRGDINPGGAVIAGGDIIVWGRLRGIAHAGANGNYQATIRALRLEATQIRIASRAARVPPADGETPQPEVAHIDGNTIRISSAYDYDKKVIPKQPLPKIFKG
ncbi:MAG: septum site-determining protein MinC [Cyanophyceae cyanobacterium]